MDIQTKTEAFTKTKANFLQKKLTKTEINNK